MQATCARISLFALCLLSTLALLATPQLAPAASLKPFKAHYKTTYHVGIPITVRATQELKQIGADEWLMTFTGQTFFARLDERSRFRIEGDQLRPQHYSYYHNFFGAQRKAELTFDWQRMRVRNNVQDAPWYMAISPGTLDKLSYQLQLRQRLKAQKPESTQQRFSFEVADGGKTKTFVFRVVGEEALKTPVGTLQTLVLESIRPHKKIVDTRLWLASDWDYLLVKAQKIHKGDDQDAIVLEAAVVDGMKVFGY